MFQASVFLPFVPGLLPFLFQNLASGLLFSLSLISGLACLGFIIFMTYGLFDKVTSRNETRSQNFWFIRTLCFVFSAVGLAMILIGGIPFVWHASARYIILIFGFHSDPTWEYYRLAIESSLFMGEGILIFILGLVSSFGACFIWQMLPLKKLPQDQDCWT
jgi:hypothetical protein